MLTNLYSETQTIVHRASPSVKIGCLFVCCTIVFIWESWWLLGAVLCLLTFLYLGAKIPLKFIYKSVHPVLWLLAIIFIVQIIIADWRLGAFVVVRFALLILAASLVTLTTKASEMVEGIERALCFLPNQKTAENISLTISLCLRFIPKVRDTFNQVREAQAARGLSNDWRALMTPTIVRTLKSADEISQAITARQMDD